MQGRDLIEFLAQKEENCLQKFNHSQNDKVPMYCADFHQFLSKFSIGMNALKSVCEAKTNFMDTLKEHCTGNNLEYVVAPNDES